LSFRRITEFEELEYMAEVTSQAEVCGPEPAPESAGSLKRKRSSDGDEMAPFRKVRIRTLVPLGFSQEILNSIDAAESNQGSSPIDSTLAVSTPPELSTSVDGFDRSGKRRRSSTSSSRSGPFGWSAVTPRPEYPEVDQSPRYH
jgi:hypothetical protein